MSALVSGRSRLQMQIDSESSLLVEISVVGCIRILRVAPFGLDMVGHELVNERVSVDAGEMELHFEPVYVLSSGNRHEEGLTSPESHDVVIVVLLDEAAAFDVAVVHRWRVVHLSMLSVDAVVEAIAPDCRLEAGRERTLLAG